MELPVRPSGDNTSCLEQHTMDPKGLNDAEAEDGNGEDQVSDPNVDE